MRTDIHTIDIGTPPTGARRRSSLAPFARRIVGWPFVGMAVALVARTTRTGSRGAPAATDTPASGESAATTPSVESPQPLIASAQDTGRE